MPLQHEAFYTFCLVKIHCSIVWSETGVVHYRIKADSKKQCIYASSNTFDNGLPNVIALKNIISGDGCHVAVGISQAMMLQGERALDETLDDLIGLSIKGHAIILVDHCRIYLEKYRQRDIRLENRIIFTDGEKSQLPQLHLAGSKEACYGVTFDDGISSLLAHLERITDTEITSKPYITVVTPFTPAFFRSSMYAISASGGIYDVLRAKYHDIASATDKSYGTDDQWVWLQNEMGGYTSFANYIQFRFNSTNNLISHLGNVLERNDSKEKWLLWLALKVFGAQSNRYMALVLFHSHESNDIEEHIYMDLLDINYSDPLFNQYYSERKQLIAGLPENLPRISSYCQLVGRHGKNAVYYLTDASDTEEYTFMQIIDQYEWNDDELTAAIEHSFSELALYMREFVFDVSNTSLSDKDKEFRGILTEYFKRYKSQKIRNTIDEDFLEEVNRFAEERPFYKLQPRSSIIKTMDRSNAQGFFFDALGVEYLSYIQAKCEKYGLIHETAIAICELPSITEKNKDFTYYFDTNNIGDLDELKHHSQIYDYQKCPYPIHIFRELEIIDTELRKIRSQLIQNKSTVEKAVIISDHGASRLAVIYQHENDSLLQLDEKGEHSGRCCPAEEDPHIPAAVYEDGYAVLGNYERFKGGRKANLEVHGGASLEEVVVPIITVSLRPDSVEYYFIDPVIKYKVGHAVQIELFSNIPMRQPRLLVEDVYYDGEFQKDKKRALFTMPELKKTREYSATIFEGNTNTGVVLSFRIERNTKVNDLFS